MPDSQQPAKLWSGHSRKPLDRTFAHRQRSFLLNWLLLLLVTLCCLPAAAQDALVTFYAPTIRPTSVLPFSSSMPFYGNVFDGPDRLFSFFSHEHFQPDRFVTLRLPAGAHVFSASTKKHADPNETLKVTLEAGKRYFFRTRGESHGGDRALGTFRNQLTLVPCSHALAEAKNYHPLKPHDPPVALTAMRVDEQAFPTSCDYIAAPNQSTQSQTAIKP